MSILAALLMSVGVQPTETQTINAIHRAVAFFDAEVSVEGGYVFRWSSDLTRREGEIAVSAETAWIEPPATPAVGLAFLEAYQLTNDPILLAAAKRTATALIRGQLVSGGWGESIEFGQAQRKRIAYRVDGGAVNKRLNLTTLDDDKTQSAIRFLQRLDFQLKFQDQAIHESTLYAITQLIRAQYPNGAWPQRFQGTEKVDDAPVLAASHPETWSRVHPGEKYSSYYTLNDDTISDVIKTLLESAEIYGDATMLASAKRGGDFLILAQMPAPQPGWAQQYNAEMHPSWARKFEPPAISGGESQTVMRTLLTLYRATGDKKFLAPLPSAFAYYQSCQKFNGQLARFYELHTNRPLFFTRDYQLTYEPNDLPTHYAFLVGSSLDKISEEFDACRQGKLQKLTFLSKPSPPKDATRLGKEATAVIDALDDRGAWLSTGKLKGDSVESKVIESKVFIKNLRILAIYLAALQQKP